MKQAKMMFVVLFTFIATFALAGVAQADPKKAYQGGKALSGQFKGSNKVDDRDFEQRTRDYAYDRGAGKKGDFWGEKKPSTGKSTGSSRKGAK
ncbi:MAG: hypothetical protein WAZ40_03660 [Minisyncoccia bacterium]